MSSYGSGEDFIISSFCVVVILVNRGFFEGYRFWRFCWKRGFYIANFFFLIDGVLCGVGVVGGVERRYVVCSFYSFFLSISIFLGCVWFVIF